MVLHFLGVSNIMPAEPSVSPINVKQFHGLTLRHNDELQTRDVQILAKAITTSPKLPRRARRNGSKIVQWPEGPEKIS